MYHEFYEAHDEARSSRVTMLSGHTHTHTIVVRFNSRWRERRGLAYLVIDYLRFRAKASFSQHNANRE